MDDSEIKGPDPDIWGDAQITSGPGEEVPEDLKGPDPDQWNDQESEIDNTACVAAYEAEIAGAIIIKGPDALHWENTNE